jgi:KaiC/GvpD/RAD55 family RecA-like ATPase/DNA-binding MarR family transcriptional regulator
MAISDINYALEYFKKAVIPAFQDLSESDSRCKIIDPIFNCLGWTEKDITREEHVHEGYIDYVFREGELVLFILEAKKVGTEFTLPDSTKKTNYRMETVLKDPETRKAIEQVQYYCIELGSKFGVVSNGRQFLIFEAFRSQRKWREGPCIVFSSIESIESNFTLFWNVLSKQEVLRGSLRKFVSELPIQLSFVRPLDLRNNVIIGRNYLVSSLSSMISYIFDELTDKRRLEVLKACYVKRGYFQDEFKYLKSRFDQMPYYSRQFEINWFIDTASYAGAFQLIYNKCRELIKGDPSTGFVILLLGGVGSGKTTFIHHFFKITLADRKIVWFYVNFRESDPDPETVTTHIYTSIADQYNYEYSKLTMGNRTIGEELKELGLGEVKPDSQNIMILFSLLKLKGYTTSIVLDNVDRHAFTSPKYQERVIQSAFHLANELKTVTILTLREESFYRSTRLGVLDTIHTSACNKFHIETPYFDDLIRERVNYAVEFLNRGKEEIFEKTQNIDLRIDDLKLFFRILKNSLDVTSDKGAEIIQFINQISGGDMRKALDYFNEYMTSANTDIREMFKKEEPIPLNAPPSMHYQIPLHHVVKSIMIGEHRYYSSANEKLPVMNVFSLNPRLTESHFLKLRILAFLYKMSNHFEAYERGFVSISTVKETAHRLGTSITATEEALKELAKYLLVEFENQDRDGYATAAYVKLTSTGQYYLNKLVGSFAYVDLVYADTPICDYDVANELSRKMFLVAKSDDRIEDSRTELQRMDIRFKRTWIFLEYLKNMEDKELQENPDLLHSDFGRVKFMERIINQYKKEKAKILNSLRRKHWYNYYATHDIGYKASG